ncbi:MAG: hypothetical protein PGN23_08935 [Sphingomonas adhaesiva]|uniref:hypothetical protein n=1 Tax=Sphingomonas adhaesiva TaxID=28212 RepID=UPI002FF90D2C
MYEVGLRIAGHLPQPEPRELIEAVAGEQRRGRPEGAVAQEHSRDSGEVSAGGGGVGHLVLPDFRPHHRGHFHRFIPL